MREGHWIVLHEVSLAPTDVLEALNRLLGDNRELMIPETQEVVRSHRHFMLFATQNPSGLYVGRKVPSRAVRNRFLEGHFADVPSEELEKWRQTGRVSEAKQGFATPRDLFRWANRDWKVKAGTGNQDLAETGYMLLG